MLLCRRRATDCGDRGDIGESEEVFQDVLDKLLEFDQLNHHRKILGTVFKVFLP